MSAPTRTPGTLEEGQTAVGPMLGGSYDTTKQESFPQTEPTTLAGRIGRHVQILEQQLVAYNLEARGIQRVEEHERHAVGWKDYLQVFLLWVSINLAANNVTLGMLAPAVYGLSFLDASLCAVFGSIIGSIPVAYIATWGPASGNRTMVRDFIRYVWQSLDLRSLIGRYSPVTQWGGGRANWLCCSTSLSLSATP